MFGVAEAASGQCLVSRFPELTTSYGALLRSSTVKYRRPATEESDLQAIGTFSDEVAARFMEKLTARGRAAVDVDVSVTQADVEVFTGTYAWFVATTKS